MEYNVRYEYQGGETYEISQGKGKSIDIALYAGNNDKSYNSSSKNW